MNNISISLSEGDRQGVSEVRVDGVIDTATAGELEAVIDSLLKRQRYAILIDLAGVDYISSAGWGIFISHIKDIRDNDGDIKLASMIPNVYEIYELLEFDKVLRSYTSIDEARVDFGNGSEVVSSKKKSGRLTAVSISDDLTSKSTSNQFTINNDLGGMLGGGNLETAILRLVKDDPFATIGEIGRDLRGMGGFDRVGWWDVFGVLRRRGLVRRRSRFRFARGRR
ncbi:MAG: STAS domain-containing protein [candidate division Zixibacteria bacterium]|nr:STAS domain-containing protein [candidate division Zixibacteria bacterium]